MVVSVNPSPSWLLFSNYTWSLVYGSNSNLFLPSVRKIVFSTTVLVGGLTITVNVQKQLWCVQETGLKINILSISEISTATDSDDDGFVADLSRWLINGSYNINFDFNCVVSRTRSSSASHHSSSESQLVYSCLV